MIYVEPARCRGTHKDIMNIIYPDIWESGPGQYSITFPVVVDDGVQTHANVDPFADVVRGDDFWAAVDAIFTELDERWTVGPRFDTTDEETDWLADQLMAVEGLYEYWSDNVAVEEV